MAFKSSFTMLRSHLYVKPSKKSRVAEGHTWRLLPGKVAKHAPRNGDVDSVVPTQPRNCPKVATFHSILQYHVVLQVRVLRIGFM